MDKQPSLILERYSTRVIAIGFGLVVALMLALVVFSLSRLSAISSALDNVADEHNNHAASAYTMYDVSRERAFLLYNITFDTDPFSRDEKIQQFYNLGAAFGEARTKLRASELVSAEKKMLEEQGIFTSVTMNLQQEVVDLVAADRMAEASHLLQAKAIPAQARAFEVINAFFQFQVQETRDMVAAAAKLEKSAQAYMLMGGAAAIALAVLIAVFVSRSMSDLMLRLSGTKVRLEESVEDLEFQKQALDEHAIVSIADALGQITYVNEKFCQVSQYSVEELLGQDHRILNSGFHPKEFFAVLWKTITSGKVWHGEVCNRKKNGDLYWVETTVRPVLDASGKPCQYVTIRTEITRIKEAELVLQRGKEELENLVSERTAELREREELLGLITSSAHDAIVMVDDSGVLTYWNEAADKIFGYPREEAVGKNFLALIVPPQSGYREKYEAGLNQLATAESGHTGEAVELEIVRKDGAECFVELSLSSVQIRGRWHGIGIARDITDRKRAEEQLKLQATTDALTGIANRRQFDVVFEMEMRRADRHHLPLAVMIVDIDHFKQVNDVYGHQVGDNVLVELTRLISKTIRAHDFFARWGGEEFVILSPGSDAESMRLLAEKLRVAVEMHDFPNISRVTCSFGLAEYCTGDSAENFVGRADAGLYRAKENGRNRVEMA
ncbi:MAG: diguanylate cyclase [Gammaproteobacteria bacterium]|nr:diguanylate cyclase [Gammaproteobacteria bacterium]MBU1979729.1 diguanylate cyclase [Gammaproteobacteria bacterium]